jgi:C4-dicarboxylate transporter, DctM subunit
MSDAPDKSGDIPVEGEATEVSVSFWPRVVGWLKTFENLILVAVIGALVLLPLMEAALRKIFAASIPGAPTIMQHFTLLIGMLGGAIAARENRLLSMSALPSVLTGKAKAICLFIGLSVAAAFTLFLLEGSYSFVSQEKQFGDMLVGKLPVWVMEAFIPFGFALVAVRIWLNTAEKWSLRAAALIPIVILFWLWRTAPGGAENLVWPALAVLLVATILGAPVFVTLGGATAVLFWGSNGGAWAGEGEEAISNIASLALDHYSLNTNPTLPTVPLFTLAGYFLAEGGASRRLVRVFQSLIGWLRGGSAIMTCLVCAFFTTFTGASGVTILALGGLLLPVLLSSKFSERHALGFVTSAGALGSLFPPCLTLILYSIRAENVTIQEIFLGGLVPGFILVGGMAALGMWLAKKDDSDKQPFDFKEARGAIWEAKWELLLPVVALVGLFGGFATPVETAAMTAFYAFAIETFVYRDLKLTRDVPRVMTECGLVVGGVLMILGVALGFTNYLVDVQVADRALEWAQNNLNNKYVFLLALNVFLIAVGCIMDVYSAIIIVVPLMVPMGEAFGIHPVHLGIVFLANLELGYLTPPVGMNLFLASYRFNKPLTEVYRSIIPMLAVRIVGVALITYIPFLSTGLPDWLTPQVEADAGGGESDGMDLLDGMDDLDLLSEDPKL